MSSTKYHCHEACGIPGVPGIFAGLIVEVDDATREVLSLTSIGSVAPVEAQASTPPLEVISSTVPPKSSKNTKE